MLKKLCILEGRDPITAFQNFSAGKASKIGVSKEGKLVCQKSALGIDTSLRKVIDQVSQFTDRYFNIINKAPNQDYILKNPQELGDIALGLEKISNNRKEKQRSLAGRLCYFLHEFVFGTESKLESCIKKIREIIAHSKTIKSRESPRHIAIAEKVACSDRTEKHILYQTRGEFKGRKEDHRSFQSILSEEISIDDLDTSFKKALFDAIPQHKIRHKIFPFFAQILNEYTDKIQKTPSIDVSYIDFSEEFLTLIQTSFEKIPDDDEVEIDIEIDAQTRRKANLKEDFKEFFKQAAQMANQPDFGMEGSQILPPFEAPKEESSNPAPISKEQKLDGIKRNNGWDLADLKDKTPQIQSVLQDPACKAAIEAYFEQIKQKALDTHTSC